jgi:hypothetical protein
MGPASWENMQAFGSAKPRHERMYVSLYGVESMTGRVEVGPFEVASTSDLLGATDDVRPAVRMDIHRLPPDLIYGYRSTALHQGRPFPAPMCEPPRAFDSGVAIERPLGLSSAAYNASWVKDEYPMLLATFEYLVHGALLNWWEHLSS